MRWYSRVGPGPVFAYEWLTTTRRWQLYAQRVVFVGIVLGGMILTWRSMVQLAGHSQTVPIQVAAQYGEGLYFTITSIELSFVLLAAPAATAGAVCLDKARGTLDHSLATDLSNAEIVLGKLSARLVPVFSLIACLLPVAALGGLFGGVDPTALIGSFLTAIGCAVLGCSLALTLSVWGRKTHEVLMLTYLLLILWLTSPGLIFIVAFLLPPTFSRSGAQALAEWLGNSNPYFIAAAPYTNPGRVGLPTFLAFLGACLCVSAALTGLATLRIRQVAMKQAGRSLCRDRRWFAPSLHRPSWLPHLPGPSLDGNPVLWREWHRTQPSRLLRLVWLLYSALGVLWVGLSLSIVAQARSNVGLIAPMNLFQVSLGLLLVSVSAATSLADERVRGSLDVLLSTPLSTRSILAGKWLGSFQQVAHVVIWPAITTGLAVSESALWINYLLFLTLILAYGAVITSLGLATATWVSHLGRAVALCVSIYVAGSIGWLIAVGILLSPAGPDSVGSSLLMGSPLCGAVFGTLAAIGPAQLVPAREAAQIVVGEFLWSLFDVGVALFLFAATVTTFDYCLGRNSGSGDRPISRSHKKAQSKSTRDLDKWLSPSPVELSEPPAS